MLLSIRSRILLLFLLTPCTFASAVIPVTNGVATPVIAIIIDDMGYHQNSGQRALDLPGKVTYSFIADTPYARALAIRAHRADKEVMLHLPMQSMQSDPLEANAITLDMGDDDIGRVLWGALTAVPFAKGINNHMGSLITQHPGHMQWLMEWLQGTELYFVDSVTSEKSVALQSAKENQIPSIRRDVFLDHSRDINSINDQFDHLIALAKIKGIALAIGHPYPETLAVLERRLKLLPSLGIHLVPVSRLIQLQQGRNKIWQASLSL